MMSHPVRSIFATSLFAVLIPISASADVITPDQVPCQNKNEGDTCAFEHGGTGICTTSTCNRINYSRRTVEDVDCLRCKRVYVTKSNDSAQTNGGETNSAETNNGGETNGGAETNGTETNSGGDTHGGETTHGETGGTTNTDGHRTPAQTGGGATKSRGCSMSNTSPLTPVSFLVGAFLFGGLLRRRSK